jgi:hypothetical protein
VRLVHVHRRHARRGGASLGSAALITVMMASAGVMATASPLGTEAGARPGPLPTLDAAPGGPSPSPSGTVSSLRPQPPATHDFTIVASGDLLIHASIYQTALALGHGRYDLRPMFAAIRPVVQSAALAICHVETPIGAGAPSNYPIFNAPAELAEAIRWTGWNVCDTASNHSLDKGQAGVDATVAALDAVGVRHTGSFASAAAAGRILIVDVQGVKVAFLAYTYGTNGIPLPNPWSVNLISLSKIEADAARARRLGANLVIVNFHWGEEYVHPPTQEQASLAASLLRRHVVDVVVGQHVHVVQPIERIAGRFVVFGEGNLISGQAAYCCPVETQDGIIAVIHIHAAGSRATVTGIDYLPTYVEHPGYEVLPVGAALERLIAEGRGDGWLASALRDSYRRTVAFAGTGPGVRPIPSRLPG